MYYTTPLAFRFYNDQTSITSSLRKLGSLLPPPRLDPLPNSFSHTDGNVFLASAQPGPELVGEFVEGHTHLTAVLDVGLVFLVVQLGCRVEGVVQVDVEVQVESEDSDSDSGGAQQDKQEGQPDQLAQSRHRNPNSPQRNDRWTDGRTLYTRRKDLDDLDVPRPVGHLFSEREDQLMQGGLLKGGIEVVIGVGVVVVVLFGIEP